jgi:subtilisin family serine protease
MKYEERKNYHGGTVASVESLEERRLLAAWNDAALLVDQNEAFNEFRKVSGKNQSVAVIDTGVDYRHPAFGGKWGKTVVAGYDFVRNDKDPMDESGHGTQVAGVIAGKRFTWGGRQYQGVAYGAKIVALRVADSSDYLPDERIERALKWVIKYRSKFNISAVNISLGEGDFTHKVSRGPYANELKKLKGLGVFIAAASGNEGVQNPPGINYPAADPNVMAVGSVNTRDVISSFTSRGPDLDLLAPGEGIATPLFNPRTGQHTYSAAAGTSFATPYAAATALLIKQVNSRFSVNQIRAIIQDSADWNQDGDVERPATWLDYPRLDIGDAIDLAYQRSGGGLRRLSYDEIKPQKAPKPATDMQWFKSSPRTRGLSVLSAGDERRRSPFNADRRIESDLLDLRERSSIYGRIVSTA